MTEKVNISSIQAGDTIICKDGFTRTICKKDIKKNFCGVSIWGDSYKSGSELVERELFPRFICGELVVYFAQ